MDRVKVGERICELRRARGLTQHALAMSAGISPTYIYQLERGQKSPTVEYLGYICDALDITIKDFFSTEEASVYSRLAALTEKQKEILNSFLDSVV